MLPSKGFTLIEVLFVLSLIVILVYLGGVFIIQGFKTTTFSTDQETAINNARETTPQITKEIREASFSEKGDYLLDIVEPQQISFYSDIDNDGQTEKIRYFLDGTILKKGVIEPTGTPPDYPPSQEQISSVAKFINNQSNPIFTYYDKDNNQISDPQTNKGDIRLIHISLKINVNPNIAPQDYFLEMSAQIRNLKDNW